MNTLRLQLIKECGANDTRVGRVKEKMDELRRKMADLYQERDEYYRTHLYDTYKWRKDHYESFDSMRAKWTDLFREYLKSNKVEFYNWQVSKVKNPYPYYVGNMC